MFPIPASFFSFGLHVKQRFGAAITPYGVLNLRNNTYADDFSPIQDDCKCPCCRPKSEGGLGITKAYVHHLAVKETVGAHLYVLSTTLNLVDLGT